MAFRSYMDMLDDEQRNSAAPLPGNMRPVIQMPDFPNTQQAPSTESESWGDTFKNVGKAFGHGAAQGITLNASDLAGDKFAPEFQKELDANSKAHPWANMAGNVAGTIGSMFVPGVGWAQGVKGATALGRVARGAIYGTAAGGISSGNESVHQGGNFMDGAPGGAIIGGAAGLAGGAAAETVMPWVGQKAASFFTSAPETAGANTGATRWASDKLADSMKYSGATPDRVLQDTAHIPNAWVADHPAMNHAINDLNSVGGKGHEQFAQAATDRAAPMARADRMAADVNNPPQTFGAQLEGRIGPAGEAVDRAATGLPPTVNGQAIGSDLDQVLTRYNTTMDDPRLQALREFRGRLQDQHDALQLHNDKRLFDRRLHGESDHPADVEVRRIIDSHLDRSSPAYDQANQNYRALMMQRDAYQAGGKRGADPNAIAGMMTDAQALNHVPNAGASITDAFRQGSLDATNYGNGAMARENLFNRTARAAQRNPAAEQGPMNLSAITVGAQGAAHGGFSGGVTAAGTQIGGNLLEKLFKPGEEHGKALAKFLQMSGPEREAILREAAARGDTVEQRSKLISDILKRGTRVGAMEAGNSYQGK